MKLRIVVSYAPRYRRGCPFTCSFCSVPDLNPGFRVRPVDEVIRDIESSHFTLPWQEKVAWFWDDNLGAGEYKEAIARLHDRGICVMAGFISGFDDQDPEMIVGTADRLNAIGIDVPFLSILTPFRGTPLYDEQLKEGRILEGRDWPHYNGYNVAFQPAKMSPEALLRAHREMWNRAFSPASVLARLARGARQLSPGGMMLSAAMNGFYGLKQLTGNPPAEAATTGEGRIAHPDPAAPPERLARLRRGRDAPASAA